MRERERERERWRVRMHNLESFLCSFLSAVSPSYLLLRDLIPLAEVTCCNPSSICGLPFQNNKVQWYCIQSLSIKNSCCFLSSSRDPNESPPRSIQSADVSCHEKKKKKKQSKVLPGCKASNPSTVTHTVLLSFLQIRIASFEQSLAARCMQTFGVQGVGESLAKQ
jgi:hypothetical protein